MDKGIRLGIIGMAIPDLFMGEEMCAPKTAELAAYLEGQGYLVQRASDIAMSPEDAKRIGREFDTPQIDCVVVAVTTFVGDYYVSELAGAAKKPLFLWLIERELQCITLVAGPLCSAALKNLGCRYRVSSDDIGGAYTAKKLREFALAAQAVNRIDGMRIGFTGGKASHMFSQGFDEFALKRITGANVVHLPSEELCRAFEQAPPAQARELWERLCARAGRVSAGEEYGIESCRYYYAARSIVQAYRLDALSMNCFPHLKARICLAVSLLNDELTAAGCEGAVLDTLLMYMAECMTQRPAVNADVLRMYPEENAIVFSHCGAGATSLAQCDRDITLGESIETHDGVSVFYDTYLPGTVTLANLVCDPQGMRLSALKGTRMPDGSGYVGNPLQLRFTDDVRDIYDRMCEFGAGVHFIGLSGDYLEVFRTIAGMLGIPYCRIGE